MDIRQLQYVLAVAEHRNFTRAAKALYIAQPSLSAYIAKVEAELGVALFDRSTNPLSITYAGKQYIRQAEKILEINDTMRKELRDISGNLRGRIRVGMPRERASYMLPLIMQEYRSIYPGIDIQVMENNTVSLLEALYRGKLDIAIMPATTVESSVKVEEIYNEELFLVSDQDTVGPRHLVEGVADTVDMDKLADVPLILLRQGHGIRTAVDWLFSAHGVKPRIIMETSSNITAYRLASAGIGAAIVPHLTIQLAREVAPVRRYSITACKTTWQIIAAYRKEAYIGIAEKQFIATARRVFHE